MQIGESRQGVLVAANVNLVAVKKTTLAVVRENLVTEKNLRIKWRQEEFELTRCNENFFSLQREYVVLTCWSTKP